MGLNRRNVLVGLGGIVAGAGALVGTGAFTTVQAERTVDVETAGDANAFLTLEPAGGINPTDNANEYVDNTNLQDDTLSITIDKVNRNAITKIDDVFQVTNNGSQDVVLYFQEMPGSGNTDGNATDIGARASELDDSSYPAGSGNGIYDTDVADLSSPSSPGYSNLGVLLPVGETLVAGVYIDTSDNNLNDGLNESNNSSVSGNLMDGLNIYASAEAAANGNYEFELA